MQHGYIQYQDGTSGMLYTQEVYRCKGYARALITYIMKKEREQYNRYYINHSKNDNDDDKRQKDEQII